MARRIPENILAAVRAAGLRGYPMWYCGPLIDDEKPRRKTLADIGAEATLSEGENQPPDPPSRGRNIR